MCWLCFICHSLCHLPAHHWKCTPARIVLPLALHCRTRVPWAVFWWLSSSLPGTALILQSRLTYKEALCSNLLQINTHQQICGVHPVTLYQRHLSSAFCPASPSFPNLSNPCFASIFCVFSWLCFHQNQNKPINPAVTSPCALKPEQLFLIAASEDVGDRRSMCSLLGSIDKSVAEHTVSLKHIRRNIRVSLQLLLPCVHSSVRHQNPTHGVCWVSSCAERHSAWHHRVPAMQCWHLFWQFSSWGPCSSRNT